MHAEFVIEPNTRAQYPDGLHKVRTKEQAKVVAFDIAFIKYKYKYKHK